MNHETCPEIEIAIARYFNTRINIIVPNIFWGLDIQHECDLFILTKTGYCYEVEIKISISDLKADLKKRHGHKSKSLRRLYFALPEKLFPICIEFIPDHAGILSVHQNGGVYKIREAKLNNDAIKLNTDKQIKLGLLASMRMWNLKSKILKQGVNIESI